MTLDPADIRAKFAELARADRKVGDIRVLDAGVRSDVGEALLGLSTVGSRLILIPVQEAGTPDTQSRGISLDFPDLEDGGHSQTYLRVTCEDVRLNDLFTSVVIDMAAAVSDSSDTPISSVRKVLEDYRRMLGRRPRSLLDERAVAALLAELLVLEEVIRHGGATAQWVGPLGQRHDLIASNGSIEVKSTLSGEDRRVRVNGLRQLELQDGRPLFLHLIRFERTVGGETLPATIDRLVVAGADGDLLHSRLAEAGYHPADREEYEKSAFDRFAEETHRVGESFPRMVAAGLPELHPAISRVSYDLDLAQTDLRSLDDGLIAAVETVMGLR